MSPCRVLILLQVETNSLYTTPVYRPQLTIPQPRTLGQTGQDDIFTYLHVLFRYFFLAPVRILGGVVSGQWSAATVPVSSLPTAGFCLFGSVVIKSASPPCHPISVRWGCYHNIVSYKPFYGGGVSPFVRARGLHSLPCLFSGTCL